MPSTPMPTSGPAPQNAQHLGGGLAAPTTIA